MDCLFPLFAKCWPLGNTKLFREDDVVADLLTNGLLNLISLELKELVLDDVVLLELVPVLLSFVEQNGVSKME